MFKVTIPMNEEQKMQNDEDSIESDDELSQAHDFI